MKKLAVIDGKSIFYRGYYAMPHLSTSDGIPTGGVFGFASLSIELIKKIKPDFVAVAWDKRGTNIEKRKKIYPEYKAGRKPAPPDFYDQIPILYELLEAFGWPLYEIDGYEADDIMATFSKQATDKGVFTDLISGDLDILQALSPTVDVYAMKNGLANIEKFDETTFSEKYKIKIDQFLDYKALVGDSSDNIPGVPGIGKKTAQVLLNEYGSLDAIYENIDNISAATAKKLVAGKELAYMSKQLAQLYFDVPIKLDWAAADVHDIDLSKVSAVLAKLEFSSLVRRLPKHMSLEAGQAPLFTTETATSKQYDGHILLLDEQKNLVISSNKDQLEVVKPKDILRTIEKLQNETVVAYDLKALYHELATMPTLKSLSDFSKTKAHFNKPFDLKQAEFLINPLRRDRSPLALFGGYEPKSVQEEANLLRQVYNRQKEFFSQNEKIQYIANTLDFPLIYLLFKMEKIGIKINAPLLDAMGRDMEEQYQEVEKQIYEIAGRPFNIGSPKQLSEILYEEMKLPTAGIKKGKTGYSTGQKELDKLKGLSPIIELIEKAREISKLKNTYVDTLPRLADKDGRIHTTFNQDVTSTGRLSSTNPNLQNIPIRTAQGREIRRAFIPAEGNVFIDADYSQFELRLAAVLAQDKELIEDFNSDIDIHAKTASEVYGVPLDEVSSEQRRNAKVINFGVLYGMSPHGLAVATGMSKQEAAAFIEKYFTVRHKIRAYIDSTLESARTNGYVETYYGRKRPTPDIKSSNFMVRTAAERAAANMPIQGTEADIMKKAMLEIEKILPPGNGNQLLQIHDSILMEVPKEKADKLAIQIKEVMESITPELAIKLKADVRIGESWAAV